MASNTTMPSSKKVADAVFEAAARDQLLDEMGVAHADVDIDRYDDTDGIKDLLGAKTGGHHTTPWVFIRGEFMGGESELKAAAEEGRLADLVAPAVAS
ncbi:hypothetical protein DFJ74DRAFT_703411 [Hyaloraphidium curvatum]|nr:hypothetical protein DFJ74DRAFT_703411 [Hyaloraphidium curvatum]